MAKARLDANQIITDQRRFVGDPAFTTAIVDLGRTAAVQAQVVREGFKVPEVVFDPRKADFFLDTLEVAAPRDEPRIVSQSIRAGAAVQRGTTIDLTLMPPVQIPFDIFEQPHRGLLGKNVQEVTEGILKDPGIRQTILKFDRAEDVPAAEREKLQKAFVASGIAIDEANGDTNFDAAFRSMQGAIAFR
jgi:hypothetical protein